MNITSGHNDFRLGLNTLKHIINCLNDGSYVNIHFNIESIFTVLHALN